jgi:5-keto 4-deoxyuronate isomerase
LAAVGEGMNEDAAFLQGLTHFNARRDQLVTNGGVSGRITVNDMAERVRANAIAAGKGEEEVAAAVVQHRAASFATKSMASKGRKYKKKKHAVPKGEWFRVAATTNAKQG